MKPDNPMRAALRQMIEEEPGQCFSDLLRRLRATAEFGAAVGNGVLDWHLHKLEKAGLIASHRSGTYRRYYPVTGAYRPDASAFATVHSYGRWRIAAALARSEGMTGREVRERLETPEKDLPALWRQLRLLCQSGLLTSQRLGRERLFLPTSRLTSAVAYLSPTKEDSELPFDPAQVALHERSAVTPMEA